MVTEKSCSLSEQQVDIGKSKEVEPVELVQMNIYQSNAYRKDLSWLHFNDEPTNLKVSWGDQKLLLPV